MSPNYLEVSKHCEIKGFVLQITERIYQVERKRLLRQVPRFPIPQIVLGQYVGMGSLIAVSLLGSLISLVIPNNLLGLIGFFDCYRNQRAAGATQKE